MDEAAAGERDDVRLPLAPLGQRRRPLLRAASLEHLLAGENDAAVDDSRRHRRQVASGGDEHRLVEQGEAFTHAARLDEHVTLGMGGERETVGLAEPLGHRRSLAGNRGGGLELAHRLVLEHERHQEEAALCGVARLTFHEALCPADPRTSRPDLASGEEDQPAPDRAPHCAQRLSALHVGLVRALHDVHVLVVAAEHEGRRRQKLEIGRFERLGAIGRGQ